MYNPRSESEQITIELLGPVQMRLGGETLPLSEWGKRKARLLLLLLTSADGRVARGDVASTLWANLAPDVVDNNLYTTLHAVRQFLATLPSPAPSIQLSADMLTLELPPLFQLDWRTFIAEANEALRYPHDQSRTLAALRLYRGPLSPDPQLDEWVWPLREHTAALHERLLLQLADGYARAGASNAAEPLTQIIALNPTHEAAVQRLLLLYGIQGRRDAAAHVFSRFTSALQHGLDLEPLPETLQIARAVEVGRMANLPLASWQLLAYAAPLHVPLPFVPPEPATFGREEQLHSADVVAGAVERGNGRVLLVSGMAGIGKTHFVLTVGARLAGQGWHVLLGTASPHERTSSYGLFVEALSTYLRYRHDLTLDSLAEQALAHLLGPALPASYAVAPLGQLSSELLLHLGVLRVFEAAAERAPLMLVLDDVQWADSATRALISFLLRRLSTVRLLVVVCYRPADLHDDGTLHEAFHVAERKGIALTLPLEGLPNEAALHLLHTVIGELMLPTRTSHELIQRAEGNPFFLHELARAWAFSEPRESMPLPTAIMDAIQLRLGRLSAAARSVAEVGAIAETLFTPAMVGTIRHMAPALVDQALAELEAEQIVCWHFDGSLRFEHALIGEVLAKSISPHTRARLHSTIGRVAQTIQPAPSAAVLLHHLTAGAGTPDDDQAIVEYGLQAGAAARALWALDDARAAYAHAIGALQRLDGPAAQAADVWLRLAEIEYQQSHYADAQSAFSAAARWTSADPEREAQRRAGLGWLAYKQSDHLAALEHFIAATTLASSETTSTEATIGHAFVLHLTGHSAEARIMLESRLAATPQAEPSSIRARALNVMAATCMEAGSIAEAKAFFEAAMDCALKCGDIQYHALVALNLANLNVRSGSLAVALELTANAERIQVEIGNTHHVGLVHMVASWALFYSGDLAQAALRLEQGLNMLPAESQDHAYGLSHLTTIRREQGSFLLARDLAHQTLSAARRGKFILAQCMALCELAMIGLAAHDTDLATLAGWAREAIALAEGYGRPAWAASCWIALGRVLATMQPEEARAALESAVKVAQNSQMQIVESEARLAIVEWALAQQQPAIAEQELTEAEHLARAAGAGLLSRKAAALRITLPSLSAAPSARRSARLPASYEAAVLDCFDADPARSLRAIARLVAELRGEPPRNHHTIWAILERNGRVSRG
jgi:DNA-binding SARP family transcriptional activator/tetratricopeptide (TPR) repeat protein